MKFTTQCRVPTSFHQTVTNIFSPRPSIPGGTSLVMSLLLIGWFFYCLFVCLFFFNKVGMLCSSHTHTIVQKSLFENEGTIRFCFHTGNQWRSGEGSLESRAEDSAH